MRKGMKSKGTEIVESRHAFLRHPKIFLQT